MPAAQRASLWESTALTQTVSDGGALRAYARQLAALGPSVAEPLGLLALAARQLVAARQLLAVRQLPAVRPLLSQAWAGVHEVWSALPHPQRLLIWPVLASLGVWACVAGMASPAAPVPSSPPSVQPMGPSVSSGVSATVRDTRGVAPNAVGAPGSPRLPATGAELARPTRAERVAPEPEPARGEAKPSSLEQAAFRAAFGGSISDGVALYAELARRGNGARFEQAARLLQSGRVRKP
jgi:hypothetical protein